MGHFLVQSKSQNFDFCACPSHNVGKRDASCNKGKLLCSKRIFDRIKANLAEIQSENHLNVQNAHFFGESSRSQLMSLVIAYSMYQFIHCQLLPYKSVCETRKFYNLRRTHFSIVSRAFWLFLVNWKRDDITGTHNL